MGLSLMRFMLSVSEAVFVTQPQTHLDQPFVVRKALTNPNGTGMVSMRLLVCIRWNVIWVKYPAGCIEKLGCFEDHLYDMFVAMIFRGDPWINVKEEDVHGG